MEFNANAVVILPTEGKENLTIASVQYLDSKTIETLCSSLKKPEGMLDGPAVSGGGAEA